MVCPIVVEAEVPKENSVVDFVHRYSFEIIDIRLIDRIKYDIGCLGRADKEERAYDRMCEESKMYLTTLLFQIRETLIKRNLYLPS